MLLFLYQIVHLHPALASLFTWLLYSLGFHWVFKNKSFSEPFLALCPCGCLPICHHRAMNFRSCHMALFSHIPVYFCVELWALLGRVPYTVTWGLVRKQPSLDDVPGIEVGCVSLVSQHSREPQPTTRCESWPVVFPGTLPLSPLSPQRGDPPPSATRLWDQCWGSGFSLCSTIQGLWVSLSLCPPLGSSLPPRSPTSTGSYVLLVLILFYADAMTAGCPNLPPWEALQCTVSLILVAWEFRTRIQCGTIKLG